MTSAIVFYAQTCYNRHIYKIGGAVMADIIDFISYQNWDPDAMDKAALLACLTELRAQIEALDEREPEDMESQEYEIWGQCHEELEDRVDDILDRLEELE